MFRKAAVFSRLFNVSLRLFSEKASSKPSYFFQGGDFPLSRATLGDVLRSAADEAGDKINIASYHQGVQMTFSEFSDLVDRLASGLLALGLRRGERVALCAPNIYQWPAVQFAAGKAGLVLVNINPAYQADELEYCLQKVECKAFITTETFKTQKFYEMVRSFVPELENGVPGDLRCKRLPHLKSVILISEKAKSGTITFDELLNAGGSDSSKMLKSFEQLVQFDDPVNIQFTSGTTGSPKAAVLTHHNIVNNAYISGRRLGYLENDPVVCCQVPLYHCFGCVLGSLGSVIFRHKCVYPYPIFSAEDSLKAITDEKCTVVYGTPTMFVDILGKYQPESHDVSSLSQAVIGGALCPESVLRELNGRLGVRNLHIAYGLTETSPAVCVNGLDNDLQTIFKRRTFPMEYIEFKVVDGDGRVVPSGGQGELCVRGHVVFVGYWKQEDKTAEVIDQTKWFHTGDLAKMDEEGYIEIVGRKKDLVIRGGENIYPQEIENFLHKHPAVLEAHICGVPDERMGEELCAWIKLRDGKALSEQELKGYCKGKISHFKIPRYIMFVEDFPKTVSGKIQKFKMREISVNKLKL